MTTPAVSSPSPAASPAGSAPALTVAGIAALLASSCCVAPLLLALAGVSGSWIGQLRRIGPYSSWLIGLSLAALALSGWQIFRQPEAGACDAQGNACRQANGTARRWFWLVAALALVPLLVPLVAPLFY